MSGETSIDGKTIKVSVPYSKILDISFPEKGLDFYNSSGSLFLHLLKKKDIV